MSVPKGWIAPRRNVPCSGGCGATVSRTSHFARAVCHGCNRKRRNASKAPTQRRMWQEARRYRILRDALGWTDAEFEWRLNDLRERLLPRTRAQRYDLAIERRTE